MSLGTAALLFLVILAGLIFILRTDKIRRSFKIICAVLLGITDLLLLIYCGLTILLLGGIS